MIISFQHKGLKLFFETGSKKGIQAQHAKRLRGILDDLDTATEPGDTGQPGYCLHPLEPKNSGIYAVKVSGNWRVTFRMNNGNAEIVDYLDYH